MNKVYKVVSSEDAICFIIKTDDEKEFWYWEVSKGTWNKYWKDKNPACLIGNIMEWAANEFVNSDECSHCGCSYSGFDTIMDAINDYIGN